MLRYVIFSLFVFCGCISDSSLKCIDTESTYDGRNYRVKGCLKNGLETGIWKFFDSGGRLYEKGQFDNGVRVGIFLYPLNTGDSLIKWSEFTRDNLKLRINVPSKLNLVEDTLNFVKFSNSNKSNLFNIVITVHDHDSIPVIIDSFFTIGISEIKSIGWSCDHLNKTIIDHQSRKIFVNEYKVNVSTDSSFKILNTYSEIGNKLLEISCRFQPESEASARIVFFSLLTNTYLNRHRFLYPY